MGINDFLSDLRLRYSAPIGSLYSVIISSEAISLFINGLAKSSNWVYDETGFPGKPKMYLFLLYVPKIVGFPGCTAIFSEQYFNANFFYDIGNHIKIAH